MALLETLSDRVLSGQIEATKKKLEAKALSEMDMQTAHEYLKLLMAEQAKRMKK